MKKPKCIWPNCLTDAESKKLCDQIIDAARGKKSEEKAPVCSADCDEK